MSSTQSTRKSVQKSETDPEYEELVDCLEKSIGVIKHYSNENYDLKQEIEVHKKVRSVMEIDYKDAQRKLMLFEENNKKVNEKGKGLRNILQAIGNSTDEDYKIKSRDRFEKMAKAELDNWNKFKNSIN